MSHLAQHDILTDLPNRLLLKDRISQAIAAAISVITPKLQFYFWTWMGLKISTIHWGTRLETAFFSQLQCGLQVVCVVPIQ